MRRSTFMFSQHPGERTYHSLQCSRTNCWLVMMSEKDVAIKYLFVGE